MSERVQPSADVLELVEKKKRELKVLKSNIKALGGTVTELARRCKRSNSLVHEILSGNTINKEVEKEIHAYIDELRDNFKLQKK